jgi:hypothetical protein
MSKPNFPIKPDSVLYRLLKLIAEEAAKELCRPSSANTTCTNAKKNQAQKRQRDMPDK